MHAFHMVFRAIGVALLVCAGAGSVVAMLRQDAPRAQRQAAFVAAGTIAVCAIGLFLAASV